jgi:uncharacterized membrane protein
MADLIRKHAVAAVYRAAAMGYGRDLSVGEGVAMTELVDGGPAVLAAFLGSLVEAVEALTIVLAVGMVRGWRSALIGTGAGFIVLLGLVLALGPLLSLVPIHWLQLGIGVLLLLFGMRWLRKAILRSAGVLAHHDEVRIFAEQTEAMGRQGLEPGRGVDPIAVATTFKAVVLEGIEVVFIVIAVGSAGDRLIPAAGGAVAACVLVAALGILVHRPLAHVPENTLKFCVGVLLSSFGVYWTGEGLGLPWPGDDLAILGIALGFLSVAVVSVAMARRVIALDGKRG